MGKSTISMVIFNSYVKLSEGKPTISMAILNSKVLVWRVFSTSPGLFGWVVDIVGRPTEALSRIIGGTTRGLGVS